MHDLTQDAEYIGYQVAQLLSGWAWKSPLAFTAAMIEASYPAQAVIKVIALAYLLMAADMILAIIVLIKKRKRLDWGRVRDWCLKCGAYSVIGIAVTSLVEIACIVGKKSPEFARDWQAYALIGIATAIAADQMRSITKHAKALKLSSALKTLEQLSTED